MKKFQVIYVPIGVPTFHLESAQAAMDASVSLLSSLTEDVIVPQQMLLSLDLLETYLSEKTPDLIILQNLTFANSAYISEVLRHFNAPLVLWALREPVIDGGRLRLNSLTGAFSAANTLRAFRDEPIEFVFGSPSEENVKRELSALIGAAKVLASMKELKMAAIGHTPQGFGFGRALDTELLHTFGVRLESIEARELIDQAKTYTEEEIDEYLADAAGRMAGLEQTPEKNRKDFARLYRSYETYVRENHIGAIASRCWPDFFTAFGTPVCSVLGILNDLGVAAACETDTYGALSMYVGQQLTGSPAFFGDPVSMDEKESTITFWHCGMAACSLSREDTGACVGVHCNRKIGPTLDFGCRANETATIFRIGRNPDGTFRFFLASGEILDMPKQFNGTSLVVKTTVPSEMIIRNSVEEGWEPHFAVLYGDVAPELKSLAHMLGIPVRMY